MALSQANGYIFVWDRIAFGFSHDASTLSSILRLVQRYKASHLSVEFNFGDWMMPYPKRKLSGHVLGIAVVEVLLASDFACLCWLNTLSWTTCFFRDLEILFFAACGSLWYGQFLCSIIAMMGSVVAGAGVNPADQSWPWFPLLPHSGQLLE